MFLVMAKFLSLKFSSLVSSFEKRFEDPLLEILLDKGRYRLLVKVTKSSDPLNSTVYDICRLYRIVKGLKFLQTSYAFNYGSG